MASTKSATSSFFPFDRYIGYDELTNGLKAVAAAYPDLVEIRSLGQSYEGREIWLAVVTNTKTGPDTEKPAIWSDANIHATEVSPTTAVTYLIQKLVTGFGADESITHALNTRVFYLAPRVNPDGAELYLTTGRAIRSSTRPYPNGEEEMEGWHAGLYSEDINGDGKRLQMRIEDPNGPWKCHEDDKRVLVRRDAVNFADKGPFYRLMPEGFYENYDGVTLEGQPIKERLDMNRNFPGHWRTESEQYGAGEFPTSEPEVHAMVNFIAKHKNICHAVTFHTYSGVHLRPYGTEPDDKMPSEDLWLYDFIGKKATELTDYPCISVYHDFKYHPKEVITGVFDDWCYDHLGIFAWTTEIWSPQRQAGFADGFDKNTKSGAFQFISWSRTHKPEEMLQMVKWSDEKLGGLGYLDWQEFNHPQLGKVEIGGWDMLHAFRNPPSEYLEKEIAPFSDWLIWQALITPELTVHTAESVPLGNDHYRVRFVVENIGWLAAHGSKKALERKFIRPLIAEITLPAEAVLVSGKPREELNHLEGKALKAPTNTGYSFDSTQDRAKVEWVIHAPKGGTVSLVGKHDRAGVVRTTVSL
jgi:murein tripeptide amidase MpaA